MKKHGKKVVALIGSAPAYPKGNVDDIQQMAKIAKDYGCGMHVDCCLGGFVVNYGTNINTDFLELPGVTSLSVDTHKNGWAPKGSSVLITKKIGNKNLAYDSIYAIPGWRGGVYGSPKDAGSQSCVPAFTAFLAMLAMGRKRYQKEAQSIVKTTKALGNIVKQFKGQLKLLREPQVNVVAFKIDSTFISEKGATYALAHVMSKNHNIILNTLSDDTVHYCVTARSTKDPKFLDQFQKALEESLKVIEKMDTFPGDAPMYCALESAMKPGFKEKDFIKNFLFGNAGAHDAVKSFFLAQLDPYTIEEKS